MNRRRARNTWRCWAALLLATPCPAPGATTAEPTAPIVAPLPPIRLPGAPSLPRPADALGPSANSVTRRNEQALRTLVLGFNRALNARDWPAAMDVFSPRIRAAAGEASSYETFLSPILPPQGEDCRVKMNILGILQQEDGEAVVHLEIRHVGCNKEQRILWIWFAEMRDWEWVVTSFSEPITSTGSREGLWLNGFDTP